MIDNFQTHKNFILFTYTRVNDMKIYEFKLFHIAVIGDLWRFCKVDTNSKQRT